MEKVLTHREKLVAVEASLGMKFTCSKCGCNLLRREVWISDDTSDNRDYCHTHAPGDANRLKDTIQPS